MIHLFYAEPDPDRWFSGDRYLRRMIRRIVRGAPLPGGQGRVFLNLCMGLKRLGIHYCVNDFQSLKRNGVWEDPSYYPDRVCFRPVISTPYWSDECGEQFFNTEDFRQKLQQLLDNSKGHYAPRNFVLRELCLNRSAQSYLEHLDYCQE